MDNHKYARFLATRVVDDAKDLETAAGVLLAAIEGASPTTRDDALATVIGCAESAISQAKEAVRYRGMDR